MKKEIDLIKVSRLEKVILTIVTILLIILTMMVTVPQKIHLDERGSYVTKQGLFVPLWTAEDENTTDPVSACANLKAEYLSDTQQCFISW